MISHGQYHVGILYSVDCCLARAVSNAISQGLGPNDYWIRENLNCRAEGWFGCAIARPWTAGAEKVFAEQVSSVAERGQLEAALEWVRTGDAFVVTRLDRLARSIGALVEIVERLERKQVTLRILNLGIDTGTPTGRLMLTMLGGIAQFEREIMLERQREGIAKAKREGKYKGRVPTAQRKAPDIQELATQGVSKQDIATRLGISRASVYRVLAA
jgi:DNA invertase Pin-like site-specific DNA recombinase